MTDNDPNTDETPTEPTPGEPLAVTEIRAPWAWFLLLGFFGLLIWFRVDDSTAPKDKSQFDDAELVLNLKQAMMSKYGISQLQGTKPDPSAAESANKTLQTVRDGAKRLASKNPAAAKLEISTQFELGETLDPAAISYLSASKDLADREYAQVYTSPTLDPQWVAKAKPRFPENFLGRVVHAHALMKAGDATANQRMVGLKDILATAAILFVILGTICVGLIVDVGGVVSLATGRLRPVGHPMTGLTKGDADRLALRMCGFLFLLALIPFKLAQWLLPVMGEHVANVVSEILFLGVVVLFLRLPLFGHSDTFSRLVGRRSEWPRLVLFGVMGFAASLPVTVLMAVVATAVFKDLPKPTHPISEEIGAGAGPLAIALFFVAAAVMAPLLEEVSFRGMLFPAIARYLGPVAGILISGFLFASIHPQGPILWAALGSVGAFSALLAYLTGSLVPSMVMHACHNAVLLSMAVVVFY